MGVEPFLEHLEAIKNYPPPTNLPHMKSFFALVEQVAPFIMVKPHLHPFRELLKKDRKFYWDKNLQKMFEEVKEQLVNNVKEGLRRFKVDRDMALMADWSKMGIGFILTQKHCNCSTINPTCCRDG